VGRVLCIPSLQISGKRFGDGDRGKKEKMIYPRCVFGAYLRYG